MQGALAVLLPLKGLEGIITSTCYFAVDNLSLEPHLQARTDIVTEQDNNTTNSGEKKKTHKEQKTYSKYFILKQTKTGSLILLILPFSTIIAIKSEVSAA